MSSSIPDGAHSLGRGMSPEGSVDPELLEALNRMVPHDFGDLQTARLAAAARGQAGAAVSTENRVDVAEFSVVQETGVLALRHYAPSVPQRLRACLVWIHGGGHVLGSMDQDDDMLIEIVREVGCDIVAVGVRRAPEHPYPAELEDALAAFRWTRSNAELLDIDIQRVALGGASSGAGTAAGLALYLRDHQDPGVCFQMLIYPMLDDRTVGTDGDDVFDDRVWGRQDNGFGWAAYLGPRAEGDAPPYAAPARAGDLSLLPPAFMAVGDLDLFLAEDIEYAERLRHSGVPVELKVYPGAFHGFNRVAPGATVSRLLARDRDAARRRAFTQS